MIIASAIIFVQSQVYKPISLVSEILNIDQQILMTVCYIESGFNVRAKSHKGACGIMQVLPFNLSSLYASNKSTIHNIVAGAILLKRFLRLYKNNIALALAAYNAGPGAVNKYEGIPPYKETRNYLKRFLYHYENTKFIEKKESQHAKDLESSKTKIR